MNYRDKTRWELRQVGIQTFQALGHSRNLDILGTCPRQEFRLFGNHHALLTSRKVNELQRQDTLGTLAQQEFRQFRHLGTRQEFRHFRNHHALLTARKGEQITETRQFGNFGTVGIQMFQAFGHSWNLDTSGTTTLFSKWMNYRDKTGRQVGNFGTVGIQTFQAPGHGRNLDIFLALGHDRNLDIFGTWTRQEFAHCFLMARKG